jgi:hypothetical protein
VLDHFLQLECVGVFAASALDLSLHLYKSSSVTGDASVNRS